MVITSITAMFMPMAIPFELQIKASFCNYVIWVLQSLTFRDVSAAQTFD